MWLCICEPLNELTNCYDFLLLYICHFLYRDDGKFKRIPVFRGPEGGYGFAHPYEFDSLFSLICYYATNTMQRHNMSLQNTALLYPAFIQALK